jgi:hypothetical protein
MSIATYRITLDLGTLFERPKTAKDIAIEIQRILLDAGIDTEIIDFQLKEWEVGEVKGFGGEC